MQRVPVVLEIYSKLQQLKLIREIIQHNTFESDKFEKEEKKIKKQYFHKHILTSCLSFSKQETGCSCSNSRVSGALYCYKHEQHPMPIYENEFIYLIYCLNNFIKLKSKKRIRDKRYHLFSYEEYVNFSKHCVDQKLHETILMCGKRLKINPNDKEILKSLVPTSYQNNLSALHEKKKKSEPLVVKQKKNATRCMARINTGRQCINQVSHGKEYCSLHLKKIPYGDIRSEPPTRKMSMEEKELIAETKETSRILNNLTTVMKLNITDIKNTPEYIHQNNNYCLVNSTILQMVY